MEHPHHQLRFLPNVIGALFFFLFSASSTSWSQEPSLTPISLWLDLQVTTGVCEQSWINSEQDRKILFEDPSSGTSIVTIPCAKWAHNQTWLVVLVESQVLSFSSGGFFKPFFFSHSTAKREKDEWPLSLESTPLVENFKWDPLKQTLVSRFYKNGNSHCGELARYQYNPAHQSFALTDLVAQADCALPAKKWVPIVGELSPTP